MNRSIINPAQIKLILNTYRDIVYTELFNDPPREANMDYLPKTLIFALNEAHATNIVNIAKEVFGRTDDRFIQKSPIQSEIVMNLSDNSETTKTSELPSRVRLWQQERM